MGNRTSAATLVVPYPAVSADAGAQWPAVAPGELTAPGYFEIQQLVARYARVTHT